MYLLSACTILSQGRLPKKIYCAQIPFFFKTIDIKTSCVSWLININELTEVAYWVTMGKLWISGVLNVQAILRNGKHMISEYCERGRWLEQPGRHVVEGSGFWKGFVHRNARELIMVWVKMPRKFCGFKVLSNLRLFIDCRAKNDYCVYPSSTERKVTLDK